MAVAVCAAHLEPGCLFEVTWVSRGWAFLSPGTEAPQGPAVCHVFKISRAARLCPILSSESCRTGGQQRTGLRPELHSPLTRW